MYAYVIHTLIKIIYFLEIFVYLPYYDYSKYSFYFPNVHIFIC